MTEVMQWNGAERRAGSERRTSVEDWINDRRQAERRRGGIGTQHPDPTQSLLDGIDVPDQLAFEPRTASIPLDAPSNDAGVSHVPEASMRAGLAKGLAPQHEPHDAIPSTAAIAGHPLHPSVVPLPIGALTGAMVADLAYAATRDPFFARAGRLLTAAGLVTGAVAAVLGGIDFWTRGQIRSHRAAWLHAAGNAAVLALGALSLGLRARDERTAVLPAGLALSVLSGLALAITGWLGGELSYRHRVGITEQEERA